MCPGVATAVTGSPSTVDRFAVGKHPVRRIIAVERGIGARADGLQRERRTADDRRAGPLRQRPRRGAVVAVSVRAHDRRDCPPGDRLLQRVEMLGKVGAGIDHRDLAVADQIGLRAEIGECRRIVREHAGNAGLELLQFRIRRVHGSGMCHDRVGAC